MELLNSSSLQTCLSIYEAPMDWKHEELVGVPENEDTWFWQLVRKNYRKLALTQDKTHFSQCKPLYYLSQPMEMKLT